MEAVEQGKQVFVFIEVKARFDEEANLNWGERLSAAGVKVAWSLPGVKVHSKMAQVTRQEEGGARTYTYLSTGNFHEDTVRVYGDFSIFTTDPRLTDEVTRLFHFLETGKRPSQAFEYLLVGQFEMREKIEGLIDREIANAKAGKSCGIALKLNSIQDEKMIMKLYQASQVGVPIRLIIRGICSVVPNVPGVSENIQIISIVDRYLEHARVFIFHNEGQEEIYLASADLMTRNLSWRVETVFPILDENIKRQIREVITIQWSDNCKARIIDRDNTNTYRPTNGKLIQSQVETYHYFKKLLAQKED
jgi:polyphosphate kinase